jgi:TonB family protein
MIGSVRTLACLLLCLPLLSAAESPKDVAHNLKGKTVFLRGMYAENNLTFDAQGNPTSSATPGPFSISALQVEMAHFGSGILQIEGFRCVILNPTGSDDPASLSQVRFITTSMLTIVISSDPSHPDSLQSVVNKIFAFSLDDALAAKSAAQRKYALFTFASPIRPNEHLTIIPRQDPPPPSDSSAAATGDTEPLMRPGSGVTIPQAIHTGNPEYTADARKKKINGICTLGFIIDKQGFPIHIRIERPLDPGLDEKAIATVSQYRFSPSMLDDQPVPVELVVEVSFHLY